MTSATRRLVAPDGGAASMRGGGATLATTVPGLAADWRTGAPADPADAVFDGIAVEGGIARPGAGAGAGTGAADGLAAALTLCGAGAALRSELSNMASRARAVAWGRSAASPR